MTPLKIKFRFEFNGLIQCFRETQEIVCYYFSDLTSFHHTHTSVRSAYHLIFTIPQPRLNFKANSALSIAALRLWFSPPLSVRPSSTISMFTTNFNTYIVSLAFENVCFVLCRTVQNCLFPTVVLYKFDLT